MEIEAGAGRAHQGAEQLALQLRAWMEVEGDDVEVTGLPPEIELVKGPRHPSTSV